MREVRGLKWARVLSAKPGCIPQGHPRGAKARGVKYEGALAKLPGFCETPHGVWVEFDDANGHGYAQVDFVFKGSVPIAVEAKLTWTLMAYIQLRRLYIPLLRYLWSAPVGGIVVCQNLTRETPKVDVVGNLAEAMRRVYVDPTCIPVLHLPILTKESHHATRAKSGLPTWWRKGETAPRVGGARKREDTSGEVAFGNSLGGR